MMWAFITSDIPKDDFKAQYPQALLQNFNDGQNPRTNWNTNETVRIAEYWVRTNKKRTLQLLSQAIDLKGNGSDVRDKVYKDEYGELPEGVKVLKSRPVDEPSVRWYKITNQEVLAEGDWPGKWIPIVAVLGDEFVVDGKKLLISLTRFIRDSQVLYNVFRSQQAETIALTPKPPWVGAVGQFKTTPRRWQNSNNTNYAFLEYDAVAVGGQPVPPPQRVSAEPPIQAINEAVMQADQDLQQGTGIYPAALGKDSQEVSGIAIKSRQKQSDVSNFHFLDNFRRSMRYLGIILLDLIPHYYDRADRIIRIVKPDDTHEMVLINGTTEYKGKPAFFDPDVGHFDITVEVGPSFQSKREQVFDMLVQFAESNPQLWQIGGDLIMRAAPLPGSLGTEMADRMKRMLAPAIQQMLEGSGQEQDPAQAQQKLAQLQQMNQMLIEQLNHVSTILSTKKMDLESRERVAVINAQAKIIGAELMGKFQAGVALAQQDFDALNHRLSMLHENIQLISDQDFQAQQQQSQQQHEQQMQQQQAQQPPQAS
jgi:hypothetical protein